MSLYRLAANDPATLAVGKHQFAYLYQGYGQRPLRIDLLDGTITPSGIDEPPTPPDVAEAGPVKYYVARADVGYGGRQYTLPPVIQFDGTAERKAVARCFLDGDRIGSALLVDGGRGYLAPPDATLDATPGSGAVLEAVLAGIAPPTTGLNAAEIIRGADYAPCLPPVDYDGVPCPGATPNPAWTSQDAKGNTWKFVKRAGTSLTYAVQLAQTFGSATTTYTRIAEAEITFDQTVTANGLTFPLNATNRGVRIVDQGADYSGDVIIEVRGAPRGPSGIPDQSLCGSTSTQPLVISFTRAAVVTTASRPIASVIVRNGGSGYTGTPSVTVSTQYGSGATLRAATSNGRITGVSVVSGGLYTDTPDLAVDSGGGAVIPIARAHLRGVYQCCYRYVDDTPEDRGGPICSSISPIFELDCGEGVGAVAWSYADPPVVDGRTLKVELWRTTGDQAYQLYRLPESAKTLDDLTDSELQDPNRENYLSMPILLPNGELNAGRFGVPPSDKAVACMFQDRLWIAGDTSGLEPNTLYYSEVDEPESIPDVNDLVLQTNVKGHDAITALIPYGGSLGVMQAHHAYRLSYVAQPLIDANIQIAAFRGCISQRCWDEYEGVIYAMDTDGVYALDQSGKVEPISEAISDLFMYRIDFTDPKWFSVVADKNLNVLRVSVRLIGDEPGEYPTRQYCFSFETQAWWQERYPHPLVGGCNLTDSTGYYRCFYGGAEGQVYGVAYGNTDVAYKTVTGITVTNPGKGYRKPPAVRIQGGVGAVVESAVRGDGSLLGLYVRAGGYGFDAPVVVIDPPDDPDGVQAEATCTVDSGITAIPCWFKTGNLEYPSDSIAPGGKVDANRGVGVLFSPTQGESKLRLKMYYNGQVYPRANVAYRDRGDGAIYSDTEPSVVMDMDKGKQPEELSSGICRALFSGGTMDDFRGNDRHVAVEFYGHRDDAGPVVLHQIDVYGIPTPGGG